MIHAFAIEPELVATWGSLPEFRHFREQFGLGTPRVLLEIPKFGDWRSAVIKAAQAKGLAALDGTRVVELVKLFQDHRHRRADAPDDDLPTWLGNAEREHGRRTFAAILATNNPDSHKAVLTPDKLVGSQVGWACTNGITCPRTAHHFANALAPMLTHCAVVHLVDPHFAPAEPRFFDVLVAITDLLSRVGVQRLRIHCGEKREGSRLPLSQFNAEAVPLAPKLASGFSVEFARWRKWSGGEQIHNRYVLTDVGGVSFGTGLDSGHHGATDDLNVLTRDQYVLRWDQYAKENGFQLADRPTTVVGTRP